MFFSSRRICSSFAKIRALASCSQKRVKLPALCKITVCLPAALNQIAVKILLTHSYTPLHFLKEKVPCSSSCSVLGLPLPEKVPEFLLCHMHMQPFIPLVVKKSCIPASFSWPQKKHQGIKDFLRHKWHCLSVTRCSSMSKNLSRNHGQLYLKLTSCFD